MSFLDKQSGHKIQAGQAKHPTLVWYNGKTELEQLGGLGYHGGLGIKASQPNCAQFPVGTLISYAYASGHTEDVWAIVDGAIALVALRKVDWYTKDPANSKRKIWHEHFEQGKDMKGMNYCLVLLRGAEEWHKENGLLRLSFGGMNGKRFSGKEAGNVLYDFNHRVRKPMEKAYEMTIDSYALFIPIVPGEHQLANPQYSSLITPPVLTLKRYESMDECRDDLYIGNDMMDLCAEHWDEAQEWAGEKNPLAATNGNGYGESQSESKSNAELIDAELDAIEYKHHGHEGLYEGSPAPVDVPRQQPPGQWPVVPEREEPPPRDYEDIGPPPNFDDIPW